MSWLADLGFREGLDLAIVAVLLWTGIVWLRQTRARWALVGLGILGAVYIGALRASLQLTAWMLQGFFAVFVIVLVVVFQEDLRRLFERIAVWGLRRSQPPTAPETAQIVARSVAKLIASRQGALLVFPGREPLERHLEGGIRLDARISEPLLLSLFDPSSPGHDGAVLIEGDRATHFALHLPLSGDLSQLGGGGTRHAAALGLSERCDALCIVVSEERGAVSVAWNGTLRRLSGPQELGSALGIFLAEKAGSEGTRRRPAPLRHWPEGLAAVALAAALWAVVVAGPTIVTVDRPAEVVIENLPSGWVLVDVEPEEVDVTLSGRRRDLYLGDGNPIRVRVDALLAQLGRRTFELSAENVERPDGVDVAEIRPDRVRIDLRRADGSG